MQTQAVLSGSILVLNKVFSQHSPPTSPSHVMPLILDSGDVISTDVHCLIWHDMKSYCNKTEHCHTSLCVIVVLLTPSLINRSVIKIIVYVILFNGM